MTSSVGGRVSLAAGASLLSGQASDRNADATCFVGSIDLKVTEDIIWELFTQVGPVVYVYLPKDRVTGDHQGYGFVEFKSPEDAVYAMKILNMVKLFGKPIRVAPSSQDKDTADVGANLFIGNLDADVDETLLHNTFSAFGAVVQNPKIMRDPDTGTSKGYGFISFADFESSDMAIDVMNGQYLGGRPISVNYAFKKDSTGTARGERHGTPAERLLAAQKKMNEPEAIRPHTMFASGPKQTPQPGVEVSQHTQPPAQYGMPAPALQPGWGWTPVPPQYPGYGSAYIPPPPVAGPPDGIPPPPPSSMDVPPPPPSHAEIPPPPPPMT